MCYQFTCSTRLFCANVNAFYHCNKYEDQISEEVLPQYSTLVLLHLVKGHKSYEAKKTFVFLDQHVTLPSEKKGIHDATDILRTF